MVKLGSSDIRRRIIRQTVRPEHHSNSFCLGFQEGYDHWWNSARQLSNQQITQGPEQNTAVNIRGNGNHVTVNQQSNNNAGSGEEDGGVNSDKRKTYYIFLTKLTRMKGKRIVSVLLVIAVSAVFVSSSAFTNI